MQHEPAPCAAGHDGRADADAGLPPRVRDLIARVRPGWSLEQPFYTDPEIFALDLEKVWRRHWLFVGMGAQIPNPGDWFQYRLGDDRILIIRGDDGVIRAVANVCTHRGSILCRADSGHARALVCPYHAWVFGRDGGLRAARSMPADFDLSRHGLDRLRCETMSGFIFVAFSQHAPDFSVYRDEFAPHLERYDLERIRPAKTRIYECKANWKLLAENFRECYHCHFGHPEYVRTIIGSGMHEPQAAVDAEWTRAKAAWAAQGIGLDSICRDDARGDWHYCARYPFAPGFQTMSQDGRPVAPLLGRLPSSDVGVYSIVMYPNFWMDCCPDHLMTMRVTPRAADACEVRFDWYVRADAQPTVDFDAERVSWFWTVTGEQDVRLCEDNHTGVASPRYRPGPYSPHEGGPQHVIAWYLRQLARA
jgi:phenylpropionate dioxygenase-like ring-hydroxylating dioxygenase large terminal subunit